MNLKLFISYSWKNDSERYGIISALKNMKNIELLYDRKNITKGESIHLRISKLIDQADCILVLLTNNGIRSLEVREELARAHDRGKDIIPIVAQDVSTADLPWFLRDINFISYNPKDFVSLIQEIKNELKAKINIHKPINVKQNPFLNKIQKDKKEKLISRINAILNYYENFRSIKQSYEDLLNNLHPEIINIVSYHQKIYLFKIITSKIRELCKSRKTQDEFITLEEIDNIIHVAFRKYNETYKKTPNNEDFTKREIQDFNNIKEFFDDEVFIKRLISEFHPDRVYSKELSEEEKYIEIEKYSESFKKVMNLKENKDFLGILKEAMSRNIDIGKITTNNYSIDYAKIELLLENYNKDYWNKKKQQLTDYYSNIKILESKSNSLSMKDLHDLIKMNKQTNKNLKVELNIIIQQCEAIRDKMKSIIEEKIKNLVEGGKKVC